MTFPASESAPLKRIEALHQEWRNAHVEALRDLPEDPASLYVTDGFYPHYFDQKVRILFVGRESRGLSGDDYIETLWDAYVNENAVGGRALNQSKFHRLLFYVTYALTHRTFRYSDIPYATELAASFGQPGGLSWAAMNLSKLSNDTENWTTQWDLVGLSLKVSKERQFHRQMVRILKPHVIVTMNLGGHLDLLADVEPLSRNTNMNAYAANYGGGQSLLLDMYHFSAPGKADDRCFITPLSEIAPLLMPRFCPDWTT